MKPEEERRRFAGHRKLAGPLEILPGVGLGPLRFRMSQAEVEKILGPPEGVSEFDSDIHLYYHNFGIFLFFSGEEGGGLSGIEVNANCCCTLDGKGLFPGKREEIAELLRSSSGLFDDNASSIVRLESEGATRITSANLGMDFYFLADGALESVNWCEL